MPKNEISLQDYLLYNKNGANKPIEILKIMFHVINALK